jgi:pimeloyl-ACP methyl ester carboxylesterase
MNTADINGAQLHYSERGQGDPLLLIHGSASDMRTWHLQEEEFGKHYRTIAYSRRYHWPNTPIPDGADYSMDEHVADLEALIRHLHASPAHLVGHSYGAYVALLLAMRAPQLVRSLVLSEAPVVTLFVSDPPKIKELVRLFLTRPSTGTAMLRFGLKAPKVRAAAARGDMDEVLLISGTTTLGAAAFRQLSDERRQQARNNLIKAEFLGSGFVRLDAEQIRQIRIPVLLLTAKRSPALFRRLADRLQELLPNVERTEIPAASHIMHEDNAPAYNARVLSFLAAHP